MGNLVGMYALKEYGVFYEIKIFDWVKYFNLSTKLSTKTCPITNLCTDLSTISTGRVCVKLIRVYLFSTIESFSVFGRKVEHVRGAV